MFRSTQLLLTALTFSVILAGSAQLPPPRPANPNLWNGTLKLDYSRSSPGISHGDGPERYRLTLGPASQNAVMFEVGGHGAWRDR